MFSIKFRPGSTGCRVALTHTGLSKISSNDPVPATGSFQLGGHGHRSDWLHLAPAPCQEPCNPPASTSSSPSDSYKVAPYSDGFSHPSTTHITTFNTTTPTTDLLPCITPTTQLSSIYLCSLALSTPFVHLFYPTMVSIRKTTVNCFLTCTFRDFS